MLLGQSRVFYTMANDGLVPKVFSILHPKLRTPYKSQWLLFIFVGLFAAFIPDSIVGDMTSIGTLLAFVLVCIGVMIHAKKRPEVPASFQNTAGSAGAHCRRVICLAMIAGLGIDNWLRLFCG